MLPHVSSPATVGPRVFFWQTVPFSEIGLYVLQVLRCSKFYATIFLDLLLYSRFYAAVPFGRVLV